MTSYLKWISCREQRGSCVIFTQSDKCGSLIGVFRPFTLNINVIEFKSAILPLVCSLSRLFFVSLLFLLSLKLVYVNDSLLSPFLLVETLFVHVFVCFS